MTHERMKHITELVRNGTELRVILPTFILDNPEKQEALKYLEDDPEINIEYHPLTDEDSIIEIAIKK